MAKRKNKKKRGPLAPPLSFLDRCIYYFGYFLLIVFVFAFILCPILLFDKFVFSDPNVIAAEEGAGSLLMLPFFMYVFISGFVALNVCHTDKKPIFGNKNVNYKDPKWERISPLFSKVKQHNHMEQRPSHISFRKKMWKLWLTGLLIVTMLLPFSFFGRDIYDSGGTFRRYNCLNSETASYSTGDVKELTISITRKRKSRSYRLDYTFRMEDGRRFSFDIGDFQGDAPHRLEAMLRLKSGIPTEKIRYARLDRMERLLHQYRSDPYCTDLINRIFDLQEGSEAAL